MDVYLSRKKQSPINRKSTFKQAKAQKRLYTKHYFIMKIILQRCRLFNVLIDIFSYDQLYEKSRDCNFSVFAIISVNLYYSKFHLVFNLYSSFMHNHAINFDMNSKWSLVMFFSRHFSVCKITERLMNWRRNWQADKWQ